MTPEEYITEIESFLASKIGAATLQHPDGRRITFDRKQAMAELAYWQTKQAAQASGGIFGRSRFGLVGDA